MSVQHKDIPDSGRHEPKGASTATNGTVLTSTGDGKTTWKLPPKGSVIKTEVFRAKSELAVQEPTGLGVAGVVQISLGVKQSTVHVDLDTVGTLTINQPGTYDIQVSGRFGRSSAVGVSMILARLLINDVQAGDPVAYRLDDGEFTIPYEVGFGTTFGGGEQLKFELMRELIDDGGLRSYTSEWGVIPCATIVIDKYEVV